MIIKPIFAFAPKPIERNDSTARTIKLSEKAIIFNNIPTNRVSGFLDGLKKMKIRRPLTAMVTEVSIDWKLDTLIYNLKEERKSIAKGQVVDHSK